MKIKLLLVFLLCNINVFASKSTKAAHWLQLPKVQQYISQQAHGNIIKRHKISLYLSQATIQPSIITKITTPYESKPWPQYKKHFMTKKRITGGQAFMKNHLKTLKIAEKKYGVSRYIITAILGIESNYGVVQSKYKALDALATLSFYYPKRANFFQSELSAYLDLIETNHWSPLAIGSSYAGALGMPQFMPSSYKRFAIAKNHKTPDLFKNSDDAILSIANYLHNFGWQAKQPVAKKINLTNYKLLPKNYSLDLKRKKLQNISLTKLPKHLPNKITLWHFKGQKTNQAYLTWPNFKVIMRYNKSPLYAASTILLAKAIKG